MVIRNYRDLEPHDPDWLDDDDLAERREERSNRELDRADEYHDAKVDAELERRNETGKE